MTGRGIPKGNKTRNPPPRRKIKTKIQYKRDHPAPATPINKGIKLIKPMNNNNNSNSGRVGEELIQQHSRSRRTSPLK